MAYDILDRPPRNKFTAAAAQTIFDTDFLAKEAASVVVYVDGVLKTLTADYTVSNLLNENGFRVTFTVAMVGGETVIILRDKPVKRDTDFATAGDLFAESLNDEFDDATLVAQQNELAISRSLRLADNDETDSVTLPLVADRKGKYLSFDAVTGAPEVVTAITPGAISFTTIGTNIAEAANAQAVRELLEIHGNKFGSGVSAANDTDIPGDGQIYKVTGAAVNINGFATSGMVDGERFALLFDSANTYTLKHATAPSGGYAQLNLPGADDIETDQDAIATFVFDQASSEFKLIHYQHGQSKPLRLLQKDIFTASGTWTKPAGCTAVEVFAVGGGGGGGGAASSAAGTPSAAAAGGAYAGDFCYSLFLNNVVDETITVGAGGTGGAAGSSGNGGTNSSYGSRLLAKGGTFGFGSSAGASTEFAASGLPSNAGSSTGQLKIPGGMPGPGHFSKIDNTGVTYKPSMAVGGKGGDSQYGSGGAQTLLHSAGAISGAGYDGLNYGGGGGGGVSLNGDATGGAGGDGADGLVIVLSYG